MKNANANCILHWKMQFALAFFLNLVFFSAKMRKTQDYYAIHPAENGAAER